MQEFDSFFSQLTGHNRPRDWQKALAEGASAANRLIRRVTGDGKTEGVMASWLWNSVAHPRGEVRSAWPRRLVWCLPMRVLVE